MPDVTVVVPTRDRPRLLAATLRSLLTQRDVDLEVVIVDDGSADPAAVARATAGDARVRVVRHDRPAGVSAARNRGMQEAAGAWVAFCDDDDLWAPDKLACQLAAAVAAGAEWAVTGAVSINDTLEVLAGEPPLPPDRIVADLRRYNAVPVGASNVMASAALLGRTGGFDPGLRHMADWELWIRLAAHGPPATVARPLVAYRLHAGAATMDTAVDAAEPLAEHEAITARHGIPGDRAAVHRWVGWTSLRAGRRAAAARAYARAVAAGDPLSAARLLVAVLHPRAGRQVFYRPRLRQDEAWADEARAWLHALSSR